MLKPANALMGRLCEFSIVQKIAVSATISLGVAVLGSLSGLYIGNYYQYQARLSLAIADRQQQLLSDLDNSIKSTQIHPQRLLMVLGDSIWFDYESEKFLNDVRKVEEKVGEFQTFLDGYAQFSEADVPQLRATLQQYRETTDEYEEWVKTLWQDLDPPNLTDAEIPAARNQIVVALNRRKSKEMEVKFDRLLETLLRLKTAIDRQYRNAERDLVQAEKLRNLIVLSSIAGSVIVAIFLAIATSHAIAYPLKAVEQVARQVTEDSNFALRCPQMTKDEIGSLAEAFNRLVERIEIYTHQLEEARNVADAANQAKSEFLANMSHELRTPLNGILGYAQILQQADDLGSHRKGVDVIYQAGSHLLTLINDILDLAKIEARRLELFPKEVHLPSFLLGISEIIRIRAERKGIEFNYRCDQHIPNYVMVDDKRLRQVLINLLGNAVKFTDVGEVYFTIDAIATEAAENPKPSQSAGDDSDSESPPLAVIRFLIKDTGVGMTPEQLETIFLPFEQVGDTSKRSEGTGLGLAICHQLVNLMGSQIEVASTRGEGSTFWFHLALPLASESTTHQLPLDLGKIVGYTGERQTILVVDDEAVNRSVLADFLRPLGFIVEEADNGLEGWEKLAEFCPNLLITDLKMPLMGGYEMIKKIRNSAYRDLPIIASSASVSNLDEKQAIAAGCNQFIPKPIDLNRLLKEFKKYLPLQWVYDGKGADENSTERPNFTPTIPPFELLEAIYQAAKIGDIETIEIEAQRLPSLDRGYSQFSDRILQLSQNFDDRGILELLEKSRN
ncbi:response regulator [Lyngbya sp. CCY1209]|uniref:response regulator n=1 Tax=Lyngbya sp. CCY1209 TaxID=2886103 RepID=UPI002D20092A|nr:response regulator [Lyngbya sp. CCY1209]MEB3884554.1 response regulator [Lyngbya sp. CCY1209]